MTKTYWEKTRMKWCSWIGSGEISTNSWFQYRDRSRNTEVNVHVNVYVQINIFPSSVPLECLGMNTIRVQIFTSLLNRTTAP